MAGRIKGITIELDGDTKGLDKALGDVNKRSRDTAKELRDVEKLLKFNPGNTELLAQKQKLLGDQVATTREKLDQLKGAQAEVQRQFETGEIGEEQYRAFQRELVETESKLQHFEGQLEQTQTKWDKFSDKAVEAGEKLKNTGDSIKGAGTNMTKWVTGPIVAGAAGLVGLAKSAGNTADRILDLSDITGLSTDSIQEWQHVSTVAGVEQEALTSAVEGLIRKIPQLESESGKATEQLEKLGVSFGDLKEMTPDEQMDTLMTKLSEMEDPLERNAIGAQLFGGSWKEIAPILGMGADEMAKTRQEAHDLGVVLSEDSLQDANNFRIEMDKLMATLKGVFNQIGADLAPMLRDTLGPIIEDTIVPAIQSFAEKIGDLLEWFSELSPTTQNVIFAIVGLAAAIGPLLVVLGTVVSAIGSVLTMLPALGAAFTFVTGPVGIVIAAITALIAAFVLAYNKIDWFKNMVDTIWDFIKKTFKNALDYVKSLLTGDFEGMRKAVENQMENIRNLIDKAWSKIKEVFEKVLNWLDEKTDGKFSDMLQSVKEYMDLVWDSIKTVWDYIKNTFTNVLNFLKSLVKGDFQGMRDAINSQMENARELISRIWNNIKSFFGRILRDIWNAIKNKFQDMKNSVKEKMEDTLTSIKSIWSKVEGFFTGINLKQIGKDIIQGLIDGIKSMGIWVREAISNLAGWIPNWIKKKLGIASPSKVMMEIGENIGEGLEIGMNRMGGRIKMASDEMAASSIPNSRKYSQPITNDNRKVNITVDASNIKEVQQVVELFTGLKQAYRSN